MYHPSPPLPPYLGSPPLARPALGSDWRPIDPWGLRGVPRRAVAAPLLIVLLGVPGTLIVLEILAVVFVNFVVGPVFGLESDHEQQRLAMLSAKALGAVATLGLAWLVLRWRRWRAAALGFRFNAVWQDAAWSVGCLVAAYAVMVATLVGIGLLLYLQPWFQQDLEDRYQAISELPKFPTLELFVLLGFVAVHEEVLFRGLLLPLLRRALGAWWLAVAVSSVLFGLLHFWQGLLGIVQTALLAVAFSVIFIASRSLVPVIMGHWAFNFIQFQLMYLLPDASKLLEAPGATGG